MRIKFAEKCAWRAIYVYRTRMPDGRGYHQIFRLGVDPTASNGPQCFFSVAWPFSRGVRFEGRFPLPHLRYKAKMGRVRLFLWQASNRFWHSLDGRKYR